MKAKKQYTADEMKDLALRLTEETLSKRPESELVKSLLWLLKEGKWTLTAHASYAQYLYYQSADGDYTETTQFLYELYHFLAGIYFLSTGKKIEFQYVTEEEE